MGGEDGPRFVPGLKGSDDALLGAVGLEEPIPLLRAPVEGDEGLSCPGPARGDPELPPDLQRPVAGGVALQPDRCEGKAVGRSELLRVPGNGQRAVHGRGDRLWIRVVRPDGEDLALRERETRVGIDQAERAGPGLDPPRRLGLGATEAFDGGQRAHLLGGRERLSVAREGGRTGGGILPEEQQSHEHRARGAE